MPSKAAALKDETPKFVNAHLKRLLKKLVCRDVEPGSLTVT